MSRQSGRLPGRFWGMMWCAVFVGAWRANGFDGTVSRRLSGGKYDGQTIQGHAAAGRDRPGLASSARMAIVSWPPVRLDVAVDPQKGVIGWKLSIGGTF